MSQQAQLVNEENEVLATARLTETGRVRWSGLLGAKKVAPVFNVKTGKELKPDDGKSYLVALPWNFRGAYLRAVLVRS